MSGRYKLNGYLLPDCTSSGYERRPALTPLRRDAFRHRAATRVPPPPRCFTYARGGGELLAGEPLHSGAQGAGGKVCAG